MLDPRNPACKLKLFGMVTFIFACGFATGAFSWSLVQRHPRPQPLILSEEDKPAALDHFYRELELDEQQARAIESILDEFIMQQADIMSRYRTSRSSGHDRIYQILNDDQRKRFKKVLDELNTQRKD